VLQTARANAAGGAFAIGKSFFTTLN